jgi:hypothetical protein
MISFVKFNSRGNSGQIFVGQELALLEAFLLHSYTYEKATVKVSVPFLPLMVSITCPSKPGNSGEGGQENF